MSDLRALPGGPGAGRILGFDLARALAIFGMITVNFRAKLTDAEEPEWLHRLVEQVDGRAAALFVFLAGVGVALLTRRSRESGDQVAIRSDRWLLWRRALFLFVIGLAFRTIWNFDILHFYGVYLFAVAFLLTVPSRWVVATGLLLTFVFPLLFYIVPAQLGISFWGTNHGFYPGDLATDIFFQGYHPFAPWFAFLLFGLVVGRLDLGDKSLRRRLLVSGLIMVLVAEGLAQALLGLGLLKVAFGLAPRALIEAAADSFGTDPYPPMPLFVLAGTGWALVVTMAALGIGERWGARRWLTPLAHAGQLALSIYIFHGTIGAWAPAWVGYPPPQSLTWVLVYCVLFYAATILIATLWRRVFARGPIEAVMRWLTNPRRRPATTAPTEAQ
ncbi:MAG: DUF418 domain-containing protein [Sphingomonas sp.]